MKIGVLSSVTTIFTHSYVEVFGQSHEVFIINTSKAKEQEMLKGHKVYNLFRPSINSLKSIMLKRIVKLFKLETKSFFIKSLKAKEKIESSRVNETILSVVKKEKPDLIFSFWGTSNLNYTNAIKEEFPTLPIVHDVNTYPVREKIKWGEKHLFMKRDSLSFSNMDVLLFTSDLMRKFFIEEMELDSHLDNQIFVDTLSSSFSPNKRLPKLNVDGEHPHLIFLGNTDFKNRTIDDVRPQLYQLAEEGVTVYVQEPATGLKDVDNIHVFPSFSFDDINKGVLAEYITQFDGVLVMYNDFEDVRTNISVPTRFVLGLGAGVPFFLEKGKYLAIEDVFSDQVVPFENISEIKDKLNSKEWSDLSDRIKNDAVSFDLEQRIDILYNKFNKIINN